LKIDFVTQFYVSPVKFCQTDILQLCPKLTVWNVLRVDILIARCSLLWMNKD